MLYVVEIDSASYFSTRAGLADYDVLLKTHALS